MKKYWNFERSWFHSLKKILYIICLHVHKISLKSGFLLGYFFEITAQILIDICDVHECDKYLRYCVKDALERRKQDFICLVNSKRLSWDRRAAIIFPRRPCPKKDSSSSIRRWDEIQTKKVKSDFLRSR